QFAFWTLRGSNRQFINVPCQQPLAERQTCIHLNRRFRRAQAFTIEPRPIEAANASLPAASIAQALSTRRARVSGRLAEAINWIQSLRAMGVMSDHNARAFGAAARAFRRSTSTMGSGSSPDGAISSVTTSPASDRKSVV